MNARVIGPPKRICPLLARRQSEQFLKRLGGLNPNRRNLLYDSGQPIFAGTDALAGFALHRELEDYVTAGVPAPNVLQPATLGVARVMKHDRETGSIAPQKVADLILVDGDPAARISDVRRVVVVIKEGTLYDADALYQALGTTPAN